MFINMLFFTVLILPLPLMIWGLKKGEEPYHMVFKATLITMIALVGIFAIAMITGNSIGGTFEKEGKVFIDTIKSNPGIADMLVKQGASPEDFISRLKSLYDIMITSLPATSIIWATIISYIYCKIVVKRLSRKGKQDITMKPFREFSFSRETIRGIVLIFFLSLITNFIFKGVGEDVYLNVSMLMEFAFSIIGLAVILYFFKAKNLPGVLGALLGIILWFIPMGSFALLILGVMEITFGIRKRIILN